MAKTLYVTNAGSGTTTGLSLANSFSVLQLNNAANWGVGAGQISDGDTVSLNGTISTEILIPDVGAGSIGAPITILFAAGAKMSKAYWTGQAIKCVSSNFYPKNYIIIDGGGSSGMAGKLAGQYGNTGLANGIIECTDNGTSLGNQVNCSGIYFLQGTNLTVKNLIVKNLYVRTGSVDKLGDSSGIAFQDSSGYGLTNVTVDNCIIHDARIGINTDFGDNDGPYTITNNTVYNTNWGAVVGDRGSVSNSMSGLTFSGNWISNWTNWNDTVDNDFHHNGLFVFGNAGSASNLNVFSNRFGPGFGNQYQTAAIYMSGGILTPNIYNNLFVCGAGEYGGNGMFVVSCYGVTTVKSNNNTFVADNGQGVFISFSGGADRWGSNNAQTFECYNNIGVGGDKMIEILYNRLVTSNVNYNFSYGTTAANAYAYTSGSGGGGMNFAAWQALTFDLNGSASTNPSLDASFIAAASFLATGQNLSATFTTDGYGTVRGLPFGTGAYKTSLGITCANSRRYPSRHL